MDREGQVAPSTLADGAERTGTNSASAGAAYNGPRVLGAGTFYGDTASSSFQAEDLATDKSASGSVVHAALITSTLTTRTSEYRRVNGMTITDRLPNGTCPEGMPVPSDPNCTSGNVPVITVNGTPVVVNPPFYDVYILQLFSQMHYGTESSVAAMSLLPVVIVGMLAIVWSRLQRDA